jgi:CBS-domain-containing membrane protein
MNIAKIMIPKISAAFLYENNTVRQGLEKFTRYGYTAVPVLDENGIYAGTVTEGDFLRHIMKTKSAEMKDHEAYLIKDIIRKDFCPSLQIAAEQEDVIVAVSNQNFVPIVDGRGVFCGIITRKGVIESLAKELEK